MLVPVVVHWLVPPITVKFPDASTFNLVLSYFKDIVFDVFKNGFENVKLFCFPDNVLNTDKPDVFISPTTLNELKLVLLKIVVDVACKFDIFNAEYVDKLFKFVIVELPVKEFIIFNNVVDVALILLIDNVELVDKLFKLLNILVDVVLVLLIDNIELVDKLFKLVNKKPVSLPNWFILLNNVVDVAFNLLIDNIELVDKLFKLLNIVVDVVLILLIDIIIW